MSKPTEPEPKPAAGLSPAAYIEDFLARHPNLKESHAWDRFVRPLRSEFRDAWNRATDRRDKQASAATKQPPAATPPAT